MLLSLSLMRENSAADAGRMSTGQQEHMLLLEDEQQQLLLDKVPSARAFAPLLAKTADAYQKMQDARTEGCSVCE